MSTEELRKAVDVAARLDALMPELEFSRETHVQWRDCEQRFRDANPSIGSAEFHASAVRDYDERIAAIKQAAQALRDQEAEIARLRGLLGQCYAISGEDTDGGQPERHADHAVQAVTDLRRDYDEVLDWQTRCDKAEALLRFLRDRFAPYMDDSDKQAITAHLGGENNG